MSFPAQMAAQFHGEIGGQTSCRFRISRREHRLLPNRIHDAGRITAPLIELGERIRDQRSDRRRRRRFAWQRLGRRPERRLRQERRRVKGADDGGSADDHYHRWPEDLDLIRDGGFDGLATYEMCSPIRGGGSLENLDGYAKTYVNWMRGRGLSLNLL